MRKLVFMGMRKNEFRLSELIRAFEQQPKYKQRLYLAKVRSFWQTNMGKTIAQGVTKMYISDQKLVLVVRSSTLKHELQMSKASILKKANEIVEEEYFQDVLIR